MAETLLPTSYGLGFGLGLEHCGLVNDQSYRLIYCRPTHYFQAGFNTPIATNPTASDSLVITGAL